MANHQVVWQHRIFYGCRILNADISVSLGFEKHPRRAKAKNPQYSSEVGGRVANKFHHDVVLRGQVGSTHCVPRCLRSSGLAAVTLWISVALHVQRCMPPAYAMGPVRVSWVTSGQSSFVVHVITFVCA